MPDERYFELKYNINLLKAASAILIFLIGFLGFTTYRDIVDNVENDFSNRFTEQNSRIDSLTQILSSYEKFVDSLKSEAGQSIDNLSDVRREFGIINKKVIQTQRALKYIPRIFVVRNLWYNEEKESKEMGSGIQYFYDNLKNIHGENLPDFKAPPLIMIQGDGAEFIINENTDEHFDISLFASSGKGQHKGKYKFGIWIVSLD